MAAAGASQRRGERSGCGKSALRPDPAETGGPAGGRMGNRALVLGLAFFFHFAGALCALADDVPVLRISNWKTGEVYVEKPAKVNATLFFGWIHSLENIPWNEYYHIDKELHLVLDVITFPSFGAGVPENKGKVCRVRDGLIHMEEIDQRFRELVWLNSRTATREILLDGVCVTRGNELPHHVILRLAIEKK